MSSIAERRRGLMAGQIETDPIDIPIGVNLFDRSSPDIINGKYITGATLGTTIYKTGTWSVYFITQPLPYDSNATFSTNLTTNTSSGTIITDENGIIIWYGSHGNNGSLPTQEIIKAAENQYATKAKYIRFSSTTKAMIYRRVT